MLARDRTVVDVHRVQALVVAVDSPDLGETAAAELGTSPWRHGKGEGSTTVRSSLISGRSGARDEGW